MDAAVVKPPPADGAAAPPAGKHQWRSYSSRFLITLVFCLSSALSGFILATFVTVWDLSMEFFGVDSNGINAFSLVYMAFYLPGSIISIYLMERYGLATCVTGGAVANLACCWVRYGGSRIGDDAVPARYAVVLFGQVLAALGQPLLLNAPPRIANDWFPPGERDYAMFVATMANTLGNAIGALVPAYQVAAPGDIPAMLLWQAVAASGILALTVALFRQSRPPTPPAADVAAQLAARAVADTTAAAGAVAALRQMATDAATICRNRTFLLLLASFSLEVGVCWAFLAVVGQMVSPCGYDYTVVGAASAALLFTGVLGSGITSLFLARWKAYATAQRVVTVAASAACVWCLGANVPGNQANVIASWLVFGALSTPLIPITLEHAAEVTYPVPADVSAAVLFFGVNALCFALTLGLGSLLQTYDVSVNCSSVVSPASGLVFFFVLAGALVALPIRPHYARAAAAAAAEAAEGAVDADAASVEASLPQPSSSPVAAADDPTKPAAQ